MQFISGILTLLFLLATFSCHPEKNRQVLPDEIRFSTTDASEIFFRNVRKSDYHIEERREAGLEMYTLGDFPNSLLRPMIVLNWRTDQAFLMLRPPDSLADGMLIVMHGEETDSVYFDGSSHSDHAQVGVAIYNALLEKKNPVIIAGGKEFPLFVSEDEREAFRITSFDFLRLTEVK